MSRRLRDNFYNIGLSEILIHFTENSGHFLILILIFAYGEALVAK